MLQVLSDFFLKRRRETIKGVSLEPLRDAIISLTGGFKSPRARWSFGIDFQIKTPHFFHVYNESCLNNLSRSLHHLPHRYSVDFQHTGLKTVTSAHLMNVHELGNNCVWNCQFEVMHFFLNNDKTMKKRPNFYNLFQIWRISSFSLSSFYILYEI